MFDSKRDVRVYVSDDVRVRVDVTVKVCLNSRLDARVHVSDDVRVSVSVRVDVTVKVYLTVGLMVRFM